MRTLLILLLLATTASAEHYTLRAEQAIERGSLERCYRRCEKNHAPLPSPSPKPTVAPIPCEGIGTKTYQPGDEKMLCFDVKVAPAIVQVQSQNHGNASCATMVMSCTSPSGFQTGGYGVQPGCAMIGEAGRYYVYTKLINADPAICRTYTFTVLK